MELIERKLLCPAVIESPVIHDRDGEPQPINQAFNPEEIYLQAVKYALAQGRTRILLYASQTRTSSPVQVIRKNRRSTPGRRHQHRGNLPEPLHQAEKGNTGPIPGLSQRIGAGQLHGADRGDRPASRGLHYHWPPHSLGEHHHPDDRPGTPDPRGEGGLPGAGIHRAARHERKSFTTGGSTHRSPNRRRPSGKE